MQQCHERYVDTSCSSFYPVGNIVAVIPNIGIKIQIITDNLSDVPEFKHDYI